jgi:hypothetical protein
VAREWRNIVMPALNLRRHDGSQPLPTIEELREQARMRAEQDAARAASEARRNAPPVVGGVYLVTCRGSGGDQTAVQVREVTDDRVITVCLLTGKTFRPKQLKDFQRRMWRASEAEAAAVVATYKDARSLGNSHHEAKLDAKEHARQLHKESKASAPTHIDEAAE